MYAKLLILGTLNICTLALLFIFSANKFVGYMFVSPVPYAETESCSTPEYFSYNKSESQQYGKGK